MLIQAYSAPYVTLAYSQPCHILSPGIFTTRGLFKTLSNVDQALIAQRLHTQKPATLGILEYSEPFPNCIPTHIQDPIIFTEIYEYSEL